MRLTMKQRQAVTAVTVQRYRKGRKKVKQQILAKVVDHLYGDATGRGFVEGTGGVAVKRSPGLFGDLGFERGLQRFVRIVCPEEIGVTHEEALFVVVSVDEPTSNSIRTVAAHFAGVRVKDIYAVDLHLN